MDKVEEMKASKIYMTKSLDEIHRWMMNTKPIETNFPFYLHFVTFTSYILTSITSTDANSLSID